MFFYYFFNLICKLAKHKSERDNKHIVIPLYLQIYNI